SGQGLHLHTTLALLPSNAQVLGLAHQQVFKRVALPAGRKWYHRPKAERSSRVWPEAVGAIGAPPPGGRWGLVADGGADANDLLAACRQQRIDFTIRLVYEHRLVSDDPEPAYALSTARGWPGMGHLTVEVPATAGQPARQAQLQLSFGAICLRMPRKLAPLPVWVVRTWEPQPPAGAEGLEWLLVTSCPVHSRDQALERLNWYLRRWVIEDYHQCLKTGCHIEHRDLEHADRIERLLGFLALIAVRLLQLRQDARLTPDAPAITLVEPLLVSLLVAELGLRRPTLTLRDFWRGVAHLGGFQGRRSDGDPGWKTLWRGWRYLDSLARGARLAAAAPLP
ncbi:MAG TPA: IS4 family transposase, partial [Ardenticatenaceae bacterium]|nr:IS4 family transposase [Ardenticatenaceae bacterium]